VNSVTKRPKSVTGPRTSVSGYHQHAVTHGVTLIEMMIVVTIIAVVAGISAPALTSGLDSLRLTTASGSAASFLTAAMNRVERREEAAAIVVAPAANLLAVYTALSGDTPASHLDLPAGIHIDAFPDGADSRRYLLFPGGTMPAVALVLRNDKGARRSIRIDPITGIPEIRRDEGVK
jgi:prepilin-type N-terminal cleavage/methylation domain-containing protein